MNVLELVTAFLLTILLLAVLLYGVTKFIEIKERRGLEAWRAEQVRAFDIWSAYCIERICKNLSQKPADSVSQESADTSRFL